MLHQLQLHEALMPFSLERHRARRGAVLIRWHFMVLAAGVGAVAGFGAVAFRGLIALFHNALFYGHFGFFYDAQQHMQPSAWGIGVILVPVVGAIGVSFLIQHFAPEARGNGVPDVIEANFFHQGRIRPRVALVRPIASALSLGSGASIGREGPIIQIGAAFASVLGQWLRLSASQLTTLVAAGAGAGIAATFNTPVAGVLFAVELLLAEVGVRTVVPVMFAVSTSTLISHHFLGDSPALPLPLPVHPLGPLTPQSFILYALLGITCGLLAYAFLKGIYGTQDLFDRLIKNAYLRHASGMLLVGLALWLLQHYTGHYYIQGVGYATLHEVIAGILTHPGFLFALLILKYLATCITLGSGASGGIFSPALYLGGTLGAALALPLAHLWPNLGIDPGLFAVAAMAGVIAGATGTALTSIVMMIEMTGDLHVAPPVMLCVALAYIVRRSLSRESAYTVKLLREGLVVPESLHVSMHYFKRADEVMVPVTAWRKDSHPDETLTPQDKTQGYTLITYEGRLYGWSLDGTAAVRHDLIAVSPHTLLEDVLMALDEAGARLAVVVRGSLGGDIDATQVSGVIGADEWLIEELADVRLFPHGN